MKNLLFLLITFPSVIFSQNTSLLDKENQYDYVIITIDDFAETCEAFKEHKEVYKNYNVLLTTRNKILSEFNDHSYIQENIRDFISHTGNNWKEPTPKYFLIAGDVDSLPNFKFQSVNFLDYKDTSYSDYYYSVDTSDTDTTTVSYSVGRIAARNKNELENYFNKVITYELDTEIQSWHNRALFVSDDEFGADSTQYDGEVFARITFDLAAELPEFIAKDFVIPIDTSKYYGQKDSIIAKLQRGQSSVVFSGHGRNELFTHDSIFMESDIAKINNVDMPFFISMFGKQEFGRDTVNSIVNSAIVSENGAIGAISYVGVHFAIESTNIFTNIWKNLYSGKTIGEIYTNSVNKWEWYKEKRKLNIFGDPSIILKNDFSTSIVEMETIIPNNHRLEQNYPNPFNPSTKIIYTVGSKTYFDFKNVELTVYNVLGKKIKTLVKENQPPGTYEIVFDASNLSSGIYFYTLNVNSFIKTKKMILLQ